MDENKQKVKDLRVKIDAVIKEAKDLIAALPEGKAEATLSWRSLQLGKMWLGKVLEELGSELPAEFKDEAK